MAWATLPWRPMTLPLVIGRYFQAQDDASVFFDFSDLHRVGVAGQGLGDVLNKLFHAAGPSSEEPPSEDSPREDSSGEDPSAEASSSGAASAAAGSTAATASSPASGCAVWFIGLFGCRGLGGWRNGGDLNYRAILADAVLVEYSPYGVGGLSSMAQPLDSPVNLEGHSGGVGHGVVVTNPFQIGAIPRGTGLGNYNPIRRVSASCRLF